MAFNNMFFYLFLCLLFFGIGDFLGTLTKAKLSAVFVSLFLFLVGFMTGWIPADIVKQAGLQEIGKWAVLFIVFSMGTTINFKQLLAEWRTVTTALLAMATVIVAGFVMVPLIGYEETLVSIPIVNGGIVATQIMTSAAMEHNYTLAAALGTIVYAIQKFLGTPVASYYGLKEARRILDERHLYEDTLKAAAIEPALEEPSFFEKNKKFYGAFTSLAITAFFAWVSFVIGKWTGVSGTIWALILGAVVSCTGMVPTNILKHANSSGIFNVAVFAAIIPSLARIRFEDLFTLGYMIVIMFVIVFIALYLMFHVLPGWRILGSKNLAMGVSVSQLLGFPATYLIVNEVAQAVATNEEEKRLITDRLMPKYLVGGFATVTSFSVIIAGIFETFIH